MPEEAAGRKADGCSIRPPLPNCSLNDGLDRPDTGLASLIDLLPSIIVILYVAGACICAVPLSA